MSSTVTKPNIGTSQISCADASKDRGGGEAVIPLVGRHTEVQALISLIERASTGVGSALALSGSAGVGKSRLGKECAELAEARGFRVLSGLACPYQADVAYAPVVEALRPLVSAEQASGPSRFTAGLTDLGRLFDGIPGPPPAPLGDPAVERIRLFEAVRRLLERVARRQPLLIFLDDLHWADASSIALLQYVARDLAKHRCLLVVAYRASEVTEPVRELLATLRRAGLLTELRVRELDPAGVADLAHEMLGDRPPAALLELVDARARGVPLFVTELISALLHAGELVKERGQWLIDPDATARLPAAVRDLFLARLGTLGPTERSLLELVSICGGAAEHDVLCTVSGAEQQVLDSVDGLRRIGLLVEESRPAGVSYRVSHPLLAEVVHDAMPAVVRRRVHAAVARSLPAAEVARVAHHVRRAGSEIEPGRALDVLVSALDDALSRRAGVEGVEFSQAALDVAGVLQREEMVPNLLTRLAEAAEYAGDIDTAIEAWRDAAAAAGPGVERSRRLRRLALIEWDRGRFAESMIHLDDAYAALADTPPGDDHVNVVYTRMLNHERAWKVEEVRADATELAELARRIPSRRAAVLAEFGLIGVEPFGRRIEHDDRAVRQLIDFAVDVGDPMLEQFAYRPWAWLALFAGDFREAQRRGQHGVRLAQALGLPTCELAPRTLIALAHLYAGEWDEALRAADDAIELGRRVAAMRNVAAALAVRALVHVFRGERDAARQTLAQARALLGEGATVDRKVASTVDCVAAVLALANNDPHSALQLATQTSHSLMYLGPSVQASVLAEAQLAVDPPGAEETTKKLLEWGRNVPLASALGTRLEGLAATKRDAQAARRLLSNAADALDALNARYFAALARLELAEVLADGDEDAAAAAAEAGLAVFTALDARPAADRARQLLRRLNRRVPAVPRTRRPGALSKREAEVAQLVAEGCSNADIAARLFISPRTVTTHLQHIYERLGIESRTGLTRYVLEHRADGQRANT